MLQGDANTVRVAFTGAEIITAHSEWSRNASGGRNATVKNCYARQWDKAQRAGRVRWAYAARPEISSDVYGPEADDSIYYS